MLGQVDGRLDSFPLDLNFLRTTPATGSCSDLLRDCCNPPSCLIPSSKIQQLCMVLVQLSLEHIQTRCTHNDTAKHTANSQCMQLTVFVRTYYCTSTVVNNEETRQVVQSIVKHQLARTHAAHTTFFTSRWCVFFLFSFSHHDCKLFNFFLFSHHFSFFHFSFFGAALSYFCWCKHVTWNHSLYHQVPQVHHVAVDLESSWVGEPHDESGERGRRRS